MFCTGKCVSRNPTRINKSLLGDIPSGYQVVDTRRRVIGSHSTVFESLDVILVGAHRLVAKYPADWQVRVNDDAEPDTGHIVEIGAGLNVAERCDKRQ